MLTDVQIIFQNFLFLSVDRFLLSFRILAHFIHEDSFPISVSANREEALFYPFCIRYYDSHKALKYPQVQFTDVSLFGRPNYKI